MDYSIALRDLVKKSGKLQACWILLSYLPQRSVDSEASTADYSKHSSWIASLPLLAY